MPKAENTAAGTRRGALLYGALLLIIGMGVLASYVFFSTLGTWTQWPRTTDYYGRLATALGSGHLYVKEAPNPALLALSNPYDPETRKGIPGLEIGGPGTIWDLSMYKGRIYLYWGPAPALLVLVARLFAPRLIGDQFVAFAALAGAFVAASLLLLWLRRRLFPDVPLWTEVAGILLLAFANPVPWLLFSPRIYEAAIAAGQAFLITGLLLAFTGLDREMASGWRLVLAAVCFVAAVGSRATLAVAVAFLAAMIIGWLLWRQRGAGRWQGALPGLLAFGLPLLAGALALGWYNWARFGSPLEFGFRYAITMLDQNKHRDVLFSTIYLVPNAYLYLLNPPTVSNQFPFFKPEWNGEYVAAFNTHFHSIYNAERIVGVAYVAPFLAFAIIAVVVSIWHIVGSIRRTKTAAVATVAQNDAFQRWTVVTLCGLAVVQLLVVFLVFYSTMRYFMDAAPALLLISLIGFWQGYRWLKGRPRTQLIYLILGLALIAFTIAMGILTGFSSDVPRLRAANPALLTHLKLFFSGHGW